MGLVFIVTHGNFREKLNIMYLIVNHCVDILAPSVMNVLYYRPSVFVFEAMLEDIKMK